MPISIAVIIPAYNEEKTIYQCLKELHSSFPLQTSFYVIDNCSTDTTAKIAKTCGAVVLQAEDKGKGFAVVKGVVQAFNEGIDWFVLHDADGEYNAEDVAFLFEKCKDFDSKIPVMGIGLRQVALGSVLWRSVFANWFTRKLLAFSTKKTPPVDILTGARVFNREAALALFRADLPVLGGFELETGLTRRALENDMRIVTGNVRYIPRSCGEKKISAWDMLPITKTALS